MGERKQKILKNKYKQLCNDLLFAYRCNQGRENLRAPEDAEVMELGRCIGFGALMDSAQRMWRKVLGHHAGAEFVCGDCATSVEDMIKRYDEIEAKDT